MTDEFDIRDLFSEDEVDERLDAQATIDSLPAREKRILYLYVTDHTQEEIAALMGLSDRQIRRIMKSMSTFIPANT